MEIQPLTGNGDRPGETEWDDFVRSSPDGTPFHLAAWKRVVQQVLHHTPRYLMAVENGEIRGLLPLFEIRGILSGHVLVSVPCAVYGGLCGTDPSARAALLEEARRLADRKRIKYVELRHLYQAEPQLPVKSLYVTFSKPLDADPDENLKAIPRKQRRMVRQGIKHGLEARRGWEHLDEFYRIYAVNRRGLGSPPFSPELFRAVRDHFGSDAELLTIWHEASMVGGVISFFYKDRVMPYYGAALPSASRLAVNDFMYWETMRGSCLAGYRIFDFGRSREGTGSYNFKRHWGFEPQPLAYQYILAKNQTIPNLSPSNPRLQLFIKLWRGLPLPLTKMIGPPLTRWLPLD